MGLLGTSHNLSWRGVGEGLEEKLGGLQFFFWMEYGGP